MAEAENRIESTVPTPADITELRRVYSDAFTSVTWRRYDQDFIDAAFAKEQASDQRQWVIARRGKSVTGFCTLELQPEKRSVYIAEMAVDPVFANQGIGKRLIDFAKQSLQGGGTVELVTRRLNLPAIGLYRKMGFRVVEQLHAGYDAAQYMGMICSVSNEGQASCEQS